MSAIDGYWSVLQACDRLERPIRVLHGLKPSDLEVKLSEVDSRARDFLCELLSRPEAVALAARMLDERRAAALNAAIAECQEFLRKHVVEEVMES